MVRARGALDEPRGRVIGIRDARAIEGEDRVGGVTEDKRGEHFAECGRELEAVGSTEAHDDALMPGHRREHEVAVSGEGVEAALGAHGLADAGEVVGTGQPVIRLAQDGVREIEVEFPEDRTALARVATAGSLTKPSCMALPRPYWKMTLLNACDLVPTDFGVAVISSPRMGLSSLIAFMPASMRAASSRTDCACASSGSSGTTYLSPGVSIDALDFSQ